MKSREAKAYSEFNDKIKLDAMQRERIIASAKSGKKPPLRINGRKLAVRITCAAAVVAFVGVGVFAASRLLTHNPFGPQSVVVTAAGTGAYSKSAETGEFSAAPSTSAAILTTTAVMPAEDAFTPHTTNYDGSDYVFNQLYLRTTDVSADKTEYASTTREAGVLGVPQLLIDWRLPNSVVGEPSWIKTESEVMNEYTMKAGADDYNVTLVAAELTDSGVNEWFSYRSGTQLCFTDDTNVFVDGSNPDYETFSCANGDYLKVGGYYDGACNVYLMRFIDIGNGVVYTLTTRGLGEYTFLGQVVNFVKNLPDGAVSLDNCYANNVSYNAALEASELGVYMLDDENSLYFNALYGTLYGAGNMYPYNYEWTYDTASKFFGVPMESLEAIFGVNDSAMTFARGDNGYLTTSFMGFTAELGDYVANGDFGAYHFADDKGISPTQRMVSLNKDDVRYGSDGIEEVIWSNYNGIEFRLACGVDNVFATYLFEMRRTENGRSYRYHMVSQQCSKADFVNEVVALINLYASDYTAPPEDFISQFDVKDGYTMQTLKSDDGFSISSQEQLIDTQRAVDAVQPLISALEGDYTASDTGFSYSNKYGEWETLTLATVDEPDSRWGGLSGYMMLYHLAPVEGCELYSDFFPDKTPNYYNGHEFYLGKYDGGAESYEAFMYADGSYYVLICTFTPREQFISCVERAIDALYPQAQIKVDDVETAHIAAANATDIYSTDGE